MWIRGMPWREFRKGATLFRFASSGLSASKTVSRGGAINRRVPEMTPTRDDHPGHAHVAETLPEETCTATNPQIALACQSAADPSMPATLFLYISWPLGRHQQQIKIP
jgi:hypothetical protein